ncbi:MAG: DUF922 domain-containing protein [Pseudomonadota bacterium]
MRINKTGIIALCTTAFLAACTAVGERTVVSVGYYTVSGDTFGELDKEIKLHGPNVTGVGKALASTDLRMVPNIRYERLNGKCEVSKARINVKARVTLPRHSNESKLKADLAQAWNNLEEYARVHEAVHLAIADRYALIMEDAISALQPQDNCSRMREDVQIVFSRLFEQHHAEQLQFDADEKIRIRKLTAQARNNQS